MLNILRKKQNIPGTTLRSKRTARLVSGFTIIEALVAISILTIAVTGPLSLASKGISYSSYAKDEITAFYLANEAIDVIRNIRDTNINQGKGWLRIPVKQGVVENETDITDRCGSSDGCYFDVWQSPPDLRSAFISGKELTTLKTCNTSGLVRFGYNFDWPTKFSLNKDCSSDNDIDQTYFSRTITITPVDSDAEGPTEVRATATVSWVTRSGMERSVTITENIFRLNTI
ncbi:MAG TPA: hypothetical protein P5056_02125 [Candidatus Paceibacterota bacterium]|nr:hypothetical protein [Candidatus Paceibacterota bacterium]